MSLTLRHKYGFLWTYMDKYGFRSAHHSSTQLSWQLLGKSVEQWSVNLLPFKISLVVRKPLIGVYHPLLLLLSLVRVGLSLSYGCVSWLEFFLSHRMRCVTSNNKEYDQYMSNRNMNKENVWLEECRRVLVLYWSICSLMTNRFYAKLCQLRTTVTEI